MRSDIRRITSLAAIAACLVMGVAASRAADTGPEKCWSVGTPDARIECFTRVIEDDSATPKAHLEAYRGRSGNLTDKGQYDLAMDDAAKAIAIDANDYRGYFARGYALQGKGETDLAIADYTKVIGIEPREANALINRANQWNKKGDHARAVAEYDAVLAMHEARPLLSRTGLLYAYNNRGIARLDGGEFDKAIADLSKAVEIDPKFAAAYYNRGRAYNGKVDADPAIADFDKAIELAPRFAAAYFNRARAYRNKGEFTLAIGDYIKSLSLDPNKKKEVNAELQKTSMEASKAALGRLWKSITGS
jgi:tetratricopeptide (TPR) repeat protein